MPAVITRGAISAQGFGFGVAAVGGPDGTKGIFALGTGSRSTVRNKYTYASCTSTACGVTASSTGSQNGTAAGNGTRGIFALGTTPACILGSNIRCKYTYSNCTSSPSGVAVSSGTSYAGSAAGNSTRGIFALGYTSGIGASNIRNKYTYATCSSTACGVSASSGISFRGSAVGNNTRGIFALGQSCCGVSAIRNKYTYSCCSSTASGVASSSAAASCSSAAGNSTRGIFTLGYAPCRSTTRNKYTYACCSSTASGVGAVSIASAGGSGAGNSTRGIFAIGSTGGCVGGTTTRNKYTYSSCTSTACGVAVSSGRSLGGSAVSWSTGVNS